MLITRCKVRIRRVIHHTSDHAFHFGEHSCAVAYAIHEFGGFHLAVLEASAVILVGTILIFFDKILPMFEDF